MFCKENMSQDVIGGPNPPFWGGTIQTLEKILDSIDCPIIVEGDSDKVALEKFGFENLVPLNGEPLYKVASTVSKGNDEALVLTDFDREGRKLAKKLNSFLTSFGVVPKNTTRGKIKRIITKKGISDIENLDPGKIS